MRTPTVADHEVDIADTERRILGAPTSRRFDGWGVLELMGHVRLAGYVEAVDVQHITFIRVDIPETPNGKPATKYFSPRSVFSVSPCDESEARQVAAEEAESPWNREF